ncbi:23S rRNA (pseudouridine(1915)-N(3))-methyltransferase RlmH [Pikeienuella piscinae]|uniref:Ribosomal RNA large subunit methyltransferase H n=1 Tax=Pikeienuella piscinae TaxID=2748098 RepID=A0A7L5C1J4_9RHOB|nr:23S rRNA (pseudouridine(1915)-N(3))-methyltransferase RlmH [Pikeienuella piscinae]QIE56356.1 23S rRNA (pseudouridine(1915)-N(3))-methyltransferase RlmH [Pikeienuella piscinae]
MRIAILAIGRQKGGPEAILVADYLARFDAVGRGLGLGPARLQEIEDKKRVGESRLLIDAIPDGAFAVALDERGKAISSRAFAGLICAKRDEGRRDMVFLVGGADGHTDALRARADRLLGFGPMVWPHMLARAMLAEQLYRAASILSGAPYHRD